MKRFLLITSIVTAAIFVTLVVWYAVFQPFVAFLCFPSDCYTGASHYLDDSYLELEHGERISAFLTEFGDTDNRSAIDFYYEDYRWFDNPIYGKHTDICTVDFVYTADEYAALKEEISQQSVYGTEEIGDYVCYPLNYEKISSEYVYLRTIALCDKSYVVRYVMIFDVSESNAHPPEASYIVKYSTYHNWGQGDGLREPN